MNVTINRKTFLDFILMTLKNKGINEADIGLYEQMYNRRTDDGFFDDNISDIYDIINNDYSFCYVLCPDDIGYNDIDEIYKTNGLGSINCEKHKIGYCFSVIEAYKDGKYLVRW